MARIRENRTIAVLLMAGLCLVFGQQAESGTGRVRPRDRHLDVIVYFENGNISPAAIQQTWEPIFERWSRRLWDATEKQIQLGRVTFTTSKSLADRADVVVAVGAGNAGAHLNGLNNRGQHIKIYEQRHNQDSADRQGSFGLMHEAGHYLFGLYDEYRGCTRPENAPCAEMQLDFRLRELDEPDGPEPGRELRGRIYSDSGTVRDLYDGADELLQGIQVRLRRIVAGLPPVDVGTATTDEDGTFTFAPDPQRRPEGQYQLEITDLDGTLPDGRPNPYSSEAYVLDDGGGLPQQVRRTDLTEKPAFPLRLAAANGPLMIDLPLVPEKAPASQRVFGGVVRGRIYRKNPETAVGTCTGATRSAECLYAASDTLVNGVQIVLTRIERAGDIEMRVQAGVAISDAANGGFSYMLDRLALGTYEVQVLGLRESPLTAVGYVQNQGFGPTYQPIPGPTQIDPEAPQIAGLLGESDRSNPRNATDASKPFYCAGRSGTIGCVMDGGTLTPGRNQRTELCTENGSTADGTLHNVAKTSFGVVTSNTQDYIYGHSCWEQLVRSEVAQVFAAANQLDANVTLLTKPAGPPVRDDAGSDPVTFSSVLADMAVVLLMDTSLSMDPSQENAPDSRLGLAKTGAISTVDLMKPNEWLGIIPFGTEVSNQQFPLQMIPNDNADGTNDTKDAAAALVQDLEADGWTAMGDALRAALTALDAIDRTQVANKAIFLLSDGRSTLGAETPAEVQQDLLASGVEIHTIALGPQADAATLQRLAEDSGGTFNAAQEAAELTQVFQRVLGDARGDVPVKSEANGNVPGGGIDVQFVEVSNLASAATFIASYAGGAPLEFEIEAPDGSVVRNTGWGVAAQGIRACDGADCSVGNPAQAAGVQFRENPAQQFYRVNDVAPYANPAPDADRQIWRVTVTNRGADMVPYVLYATEEARGLIAVAEVATGSVTYPEPVRITVTVAGNQNIGGADVTALVVPPVSTRDNPVHTQIRLYDDGRPDHGDLRADDGIYSALFADYQDPLNPGQSGGDGTWIFDVTVDNSEGRAYEVCGCEDSPLEDPFRPVPPFTLRLDTCALVQGIPDTLPQGTLALSNASLFPVSVLHGDLEVTPALGFTLFGDVEGVEINRVVVRAVWGESQEPLPEVGLFLDADNNGAPDTPARPLARTLFTRAEGADNWIAVFDNGTPLAMVDSASSLRFIVALGPPNVQDGDGAGIVPGVPLPPAVPPLGVPIALAMALAWAAAAKRRRLPATAMACALLMTVVVSGSIGCGGNTTVVRPEQPDTQQFTSVPLVLTLDPAESAARGISTGETFPAQGTVITATVDILFEQQ